MKRVKWLILLMLLASLGAWAQGVTSVSVGMSLDGPIFFVDGQRYSTQQVFLWPIGSKHVVQFLLSVDEATGAPLGYQAANGDVTRWVFNGWKDNLGLLAQPGFVAQTITVQPGLTSLVGQVTVTVLVAVQFYNSTTGNAPDCGGSPGDPPQDGFRSGIIFINGTCYADSTTVYLQPGTLNLNAFPYPGFVFVGWWIDGAPPSGFLGQYNLQSAVTLTPRFMPAKRVKFRTNPLGLQVVVDHTVITTPPALPTSLLPGVNIDASCNPDYTKIPPGAPKNYSPLCIGDFDFLPGSVHQIGAPQSQMDATGAQWVFSGFSNGLGQNANYIAGDRLDLVDLMVANFAPGVPASITTSPGGLKIQIDGRDNWQAYNFVWGQGEVHHLSAPATQVDAKGRMYQFVKWSNGGAAAQDITVPPGVQGLSYQATYQLLGQVQVGSTPAGLNFTVDGSSCTTPCVVNRLAGTQIQINIPASIPTTSTSRYDFDAWSVGGASTSLPVTFTQDVQTLTASYHTSYLLAAGMNPPNAATFKYSPSSPDGYFPDGTAVTLTAVPNGGFKFSRWNGDLTGGFSTGYLTMTSPHSVTALFNAVPYIAPAGITNAAGATPDGSVAPGSIVSIYGQNLAGDLAVGPANPLAQTIGGVTVTVYDYLLPLLFVSPQQIGAQVPSALADGTYPITVHWQGQPDVTGTFVVKRDAPGIYTQQNAQNLPLMVALHQDGTLITTDSPARRNEVISIYGTGFGPYSQPVIDGFNVALTPLLTQTDPVTVLTSGLTLTPDWAGAAPGMVGTTQLNFRIVDSLPHAAVLDVAVTAGGQQSSVVKLPVE
jgi:uncharacterized protein (TIGR03437 family)